jgi:hypothetical protein
MKLFIIDSQNVSKTINIMESETVATLKEEIKKKNNIIGDIELVFDGDILNDKDSLCKLEIKDGMSINYLGVYNAGLSS